MTAERTPLRDMRHGTRSRKTLRLRAIKPTLYLTSAHSISLTPEGRVLKFHDGTRYRMHNGSLRRIASL